MLAVDSFVELVRKLMIVVVVATVEPDPDTGEEAAAGRVDNAASAVYDAESPVTFLQAL
ncbi:hypothetical protein BP5796_02680 [Coleophoma crateriformis]|uniref:Uncharacterized protein n=1 Tax=Coleophoma crateriformis TaxID=565419 RepID=A0A3D8SYX9_9HELO|nr:hypothetical protein BP5796_02680 [Coleophoma crateriformis]